MRLFFAALFLFFMSANAFAQTQPAVGEWYGVVDTHEGAFTVVVRITDSNGTLVGSLESVDQAPGQMIPLSAVQADNNSLSFLIPAIGASYQGEWSPATERWIGKFTQQSFVFTLELQRGTPPA